MRVVVAMLLLSSLLCVSPKLRAQTSDQDQIKSAEMELAAAEHRSESAPFKKVLAEDWLTVTREGRVLHRDDVLQNLMAHEGERMPYVVKLVGLRVDVFGDTAVASSTREYHGVSGEAKGKMTRESVVDVFTKSVGGWKMRYKKAVPMNDSTASQRIK